MKSFVGAGKTPFIYSRNTVQYVDLKLTRNESDLYRTKWWDYRFTDSEDESPRPMHPMEATFLFAAEYVEAYLRAQRGRLDRNRSRFTSPLNRDNLLKCKQQVINGIWRARRAADQHGVKYDFWCSKAMEYAVLFDWKYLPRANQMYASSGVAKEKDNFVSLTDFILHQWGEHNAEKVLVAESNFYTVENFMDHPDQIAHMRYLLGRVERFPHKALLISDLVFRKNVLSEQIIVAKFGEEEGGTLLRQAERFAP